MTSTRWLWAIVVAGGALRFFPIWFGLPYPHARPDEETALGHAAAILDGDLNPHFFHWPSLIFYLFAAAFAAASGIRRLLSLDPVLSGVEYVLIARALVALAGTLTIVVLFRLARRTADTTTGLVAAAFLAVAILHVRESHFAMTDVVMTLLVTAALSLLSIAVDAPMTAPRLGASATGWFAAAGLAGGLATSTKYSAAAILAAFGAAQLVWHRHARTGPRSPLAWRPSLAFLAAFGAAFIAATPYALLDYKTFAADLQFDFTHLSEGHGLDLGRGWSYHLRRSLPYGVGVTVFIAAIPGAVLFVRDHRRHALVVGAFAIAFHVAVGSGHTVFFRYILPLVPIVCLFAAVFVGRAGPWLATRAGVSTRAGLALLTAIVGAPALVNSVWFDALLAKTDTRVLAARWLVPRLKADESLHDAGGPYVQLDLGGARFHPWFYDPSAKSFGDPDGRTPDWLVLKDSPLRIYAAAPPPLRRLATEKYELVWSIRATRGRASSAVYDELDAFFLPMSAFTTVERPGPRIQIYRRR
jgi:hypothetical protein